MTQLLRQSQKLPVSDQFCDSILKLIPTDFCENDIVINFRDPNYSAEDGGFHPVEIMLTKQDNQWMLCYITDFCFVGQGQFVELAKCLDFDIGKNLFQDLMGCHPLKTAHSLYKTWETNFLCYLHQFAAYDITAKGI